eukprot:CAMPEP_0206538866 /NCGR_PEP_ID=MMETSP0325_2-20121206/8119_1 /ASSEMBLY_ACC=CAM_ASM_000347 /TAXON_ID=2866 /ORGANISM="Crypthecodinium cohnii, Strain Seligo" /LENGTH=161 /DNA_ID=CAMNT_0054036389 /DNA_START=259 /DNA_END=746 /DNA_ORIENTATION=-
MRYVPSLLLALPTLGGILLSLLGSSVAEADPLEPPGEAHVGNCSCDEEAAGGGEWRGVGAAEGVEGPPGKGPKGDEGTPAVLDRLDNDLSVPLPAKSSLVSFSRDDPERLLLAREEAPPEIPSFVVPEVSQTPSSLLLLPRFFALAPCESRSFYKLFWMLA